MQHDHSIFQQPFQPAVQKVAVSRSSTLAVQSELLEVGLSPEAVVLYLAYGLHSSEKRPSKFYCDLLGSSERSITKWRRELIDAGLIERVGKAAWIVFSPRPNVHGSATLDPRASCAPAISPSEEPLEVDKSTSARETSIVGKTERPAGAGRKSNPIFDALIEVCGMIYSEMPPTSRRLTGMAAAELARVDATPEEIRSRASVYRSIYPGASMTPKALANHWAELRLEKTNLNTYLADDVEL